MSGTVKWFSSENFNAPQLTNTWGDLVHALKTCLIDGFGEQDIISVVISDGVGVATFANNHNLQMFQWIELSGSSQVVLNAEFKVLGLTQNTVEFLVELPDQTITETLSCRLPPLGWSMPFSDEGRAVFQAKNTDANPYFLRVDDTCDPLHTPTRAKFAKVGILESCTGIDDISGNQAPFDPALPTKNWIGTGTAGSTSAIIGWAKWIYATSDTTNNSGISLGGTAIEGVRGWILVGNDENFFIFPTTLPEHLNTTYKGHSVCYGFGILDGKDCPFLSATHYYDALSYSSYSGFDATFSGKGGGYLLLLKNRNGTYVTGATVYENETRMNYGLDTSGFTGYSNAYSKNEEDGVYHCNFHARDVQNVYLGVIPLLRCVLNSTSTSEPSTAIFSENGNAYIKRKHMGSSIRNGSIIIDLGEI